MAQLNVAREPSMDEILASIRKIIESNETVPAASAARQAFESSADDDIELTIDSEIEAAVFRSAEEEIASAGRSTAVPSVQSAAVAAGTPANAPAPLSLADVAARVRAASERHAANYVARDPQDSEQRPMQDSPVVTSRMAAVASSGAAITSAEAATDAAMTVVAEPAPAMSVSEATQRSAIAEDADGAENRVGAILSPAVGRQVARAFDDLAHAVEQGPRRSFDEIAEAMLRPMLQDWLDDNLPTLVERLVREEIERVARGPRR
ncbi:MAG TPA: PopZ family protein [Sinorhizobium sp.]|nr:PopZ family protein [Sinorhizobium sp.]